jgi:hypothetical protein
VELPMRLAGNRAVDGFLLGGENPANAQDQRPRADSGTLKTQSAKESQ